MAESHTLESLEDTALSRPSTPESVRRLKSLLQQLLRVTILDGRIFLGTFVGTDQQLNILLVNSEEYRIGPESVDGDPNGRFVGQLMVPWRLIKTVEASTNAGGTLRRVIDGYDDDSIVLLEPSLITRDEFHKHLRERTAALDFMQKAVAGRRAEWNTREDAMQYFKKRMPWKIWDPRVLNLFVSRPMASEMCPPRIKNAPGKSH
ncbi:predicted protein [Postia placenta Mad-698-R]|nr:predicted protein [Postia placenta Mad-698-R]